VCDVSGVKISQVHKMELVVIILVLQLYKQALCLQLIQILNSRIKCISTHINTAAWHLKNVTLQINVLTNDAVPGKTLHIFCSCNKYLRTAKRDVRTFITATSALHYNDNID